MLLLRVIARLVEIALMAALALVGIGVGLYCFSGLISLGSGRPDRLLHLPAVRDRIGHFLAQVAAPGPTAALALVGGVVALIVGLLLVLGLLGSRRERLLIFDEDPEQGTLAARPRPVGELLRSETESAGGVMSARRVKVRLARNGRRGRARIRALRGLDPDADTGDRAVHERIDQIAEGLALRTDVRGRLIAGEEPERSRS